MRVSVTAAIKSKALVQVQCRVEGPNEIDGFVLAVSDEWLLVRDVASLQPKGYYLLRRDTVHFIQSTVYLKFKQRVLRKEHLLKSSLQHPGIDLSDIAAILSWLQKERRFAILWRATKDEWWSRHSLVCGVTPKNVLLRLFDGAGRWENQTFRWTLNKITAIRFDSHHLRMFEKYAAKTN